MESTTRPGTEVYDDFAGTELDSTRWMVMAFPLPDGDVFTCAEPSATTELVDGALRLRIDRFEKSSPVQIMDNCKHLLVSTSVIELPEDRAITFEADISARTINAHPRDYRDGFVSFVVVDVNTGFVVDFAATSDAVFAIDERLPLPGVATPYTRIVEDPLVTGSLRSTDGPLHARITIDRARRSVVVRVDDVVIHTASPADLPSAVQIGMGIFTLHPIGSDGSRSLHGQGIEGFWSNVRITRADA